MLAPSRRADAGNVENNETAPNAATIPPAGSGALDVRGLRFRFAGQSSDLLRVDRLALAHGQTLGIRGASGAGKSTLLHCLAGIESVGAGSIRWGDEDIARLSESQQTRWRARRVGLVFQDFHLVEGLSALGNVLLPASFGRWRAAAALRRRAQALLERVGAPNRRAELLSRGERQRVAVARALLFDPDIVLADEPTASLDADNRELIGALLLELTRERGATLVVVSHEAALLERLDRRLELREGALHEAGPYGTQKIPHCVRDDTTLSVRPQGGVLENVAEGGAQKIPCCARADGNLSPGARTGEAVHV